MKGRPARVAIIALVLVVALALRVAEVQRTAYTPVNDARSYLTLGAEIAHTGDYSRHDPGAGGSKGPSAYFPPGYPYLLAAVHLAGGGVHAARLTQALLGTVTVALIGLVAYELFGELIALIALVIAAVYPVLIEVSGILLAENLLVPLSLAAIWAVLRARRSPRPYVWAAGAGVLIGLAALTHENGLVLLILAGGLLGVPKAAVLLVVIALLTIAPWTVRNAIVMHRFIPINDETGITLLGTYNRASADDSRIPYGWRLDLAGEPHARLSEPTLDSRLLGHALSYIGSHPSAPLQVGFHNALRLLELDGSYSWQQSAGSIDLQRGTARIGVFSFWLLCALALAGAFTPPARRAPRWLWLVPLLFALSVVFVNSETPRFRTPVEPFLILLAACELGTLVARLTGVPAERLGGSPVRGEARTVDPARGAQLVEVVERLA